MEQRLKLLPNAFKYEMHNPIAVRRDVNPNGVAEKEQSDPQREMRRCAERMRVGKRC